MLFVVTGFDWSSLDGFASKSWTRDTPKGVDHEQHARSLLPVEVDVVRIDVIGIGFGNRKGAAS